MEYWQALVELESGGYEDISDEHVLMLLTKTVEELQRRQYEISCEEYVVVGVPNTNEGNRTIVFDGRA